MRAHKRAFVARLMSESWASATARADQIDLIYWPSCTGPRRAIASFYDRSKPGNRRWCSSVLCGNREKTRSYRGSGRLRTIKPTNVVDARRHWYSFVRIRRLPQLWPQGVAPTPSDRAPIPSWQGLIPPSTSFVSNFPIESFRSAGNRSQARTAGAVTVGMPRAAGIATEIIAIAIMAEKIWLKFIEPTREAFRPGHDGLASPPPDRQPHGPRLVSFCIGAYAGASIARARSWRR
jgi:hypothetical protein